MTTSHRSILSQFVPEPAKLEEGVLMTPPRLPSGVGRPLFLLHLSIFANNVQESVSRLNSKGDVAEGRTTG